FVDPGARANGFLGDGVVRRWHPASRDLAYMLYETEVGVRRTLVNPGARRRRRGLAERVLRAFLTRVGPADRRRRLLDEIEACARFHLESLRPDWTPRGVWRGFVRRIAARHLDDLLGRLRAEAANSRD